MTEVPIITIDIPINQSDLWFMKFNDAVMDFPPIKTMTELALLEDLINVGLNYFALEHYGEPLNSLLEANILQTFPFAKEVIPKSGLFTITLKDDFLLSKNVFYDKIKEEYKLIEVK